MALLEVRDLHVQIGSTEILRGVSMDVEAGRTLGVVGESGCGKSMTALALMGMLPTGGRITAGAMTLDGLDLTSLKPKQWLDVRGQSIALVMQDPFTSLNPMMRVGQQIAEVLEMHGRLTGKQARAAAVEMLAKVGVPSPADTARKYPHQMSGGQRQRVVIAIAFVAKPKLLIADEPTTALDVTLQAQILHLLRDLQREENTAVMLISHDIGVIGSLAERVAVFYAGRVVEVGSVEEVLKRPAHPYTEALMDALPQAGVDRLRAIGGRPPSFGDLPQGCAFAPRCPKRFAACNQDPALWPARDGHLAACHLVRELSAPNPSS